VNPITTVFPAIFVIVNLLSVKSLNIATDHVQKKIDPRVNPITTVFPAIFVIVNLLSVKSLNIATHHVQKKTHIDDRICSVHY
jgi:fumarate reductase subunit C